MLVVPVFGVYVFELYSGWVGGNLTGLIWIFTTPVGVLILVTLNMFELASRRAARSDSGGDGMGGIAETCAAAAGGE